jgi:hypothetical protein
MSRAVGLSACNGPPSGEAWTGSFGCSFFFVASFAAYFAASFAASFAAVLRCFLVASFADFVARGLAARLMRRRFALSVARVFMSGRMLDTTRKRHHRCRPAIVP